MTALLEPAIKRQLAIQSGFSMLETLVAISIFGIASVGMAQAFIYHMSFNTASERRSGALAAAQLVLDEARISDPASLPTSGSVTRNVTVGRRIYSAVTTYCPISAYCTSTTRSLRVQVNFNGQQQYKVETVFSQLR